jgi:hypothetical protein
VIKHIVTNPGYRSVRRNHIPFPRRLTVLAGDTETVRGHAYSLQLHDGVQPHYVRVNDDSVLDEFLGWIEPRILSGHVAVMYFHNLEYDISVILRRYHEKFLGRKRIVISHRGWKIELILSATCFARFRKDKKSLLCLDSQRFMNVSLSRFAEIIGAQSQKLERPSYIGERAPRTKEEKEYFIRYALADVCAQHEVARWIVKQHERYNIRISYSSAHFSERIFRHYHIQPHEQLWLPPEKWLEACILSYHGGKNGYYLDRSQGIYRLHDGAEIDISSAYPYAMTQLPNMVRCWYRETDKFDDKHEGIYRVWGVVKNDRYPILYSHDFKVIPHGERVDGLCVTSYELREALARGEFEMKKCRGILAHTDERYAHNPLRDFVNEFYELKEKAKTPDERQLYKIILNSLYGKFIQAIEVESDDDAALIDAGTGDVVKPAQKTFKAGSSYHPFIASLITGFVRVYLHQLEHRFNAVHSSTDSVIFKWDDAYRGWIDRHKGLGGVELKVRGTCYLVRNKVYVWTDNNDNVLKWATHGISIDGVGLLNLIRRRKNSYTVRKIAKVRESLRRKNVGLVPLAMNEVEKKILGVNLERIIDI